MAHEPDIFPDVPDRVALTVCRPYPWRPGPRCSATRRCVPSRFGNRYVYGHIVEENRNLIVSAGSAAAVMPVRFGVPPEIVMIELGVVTRERRDRQVIGESVLFAP